MDTDLDDDIINDYDSDSTTEISIYGSDTLDDTSKDVGSFHDSELATDVWMARLQHKLHHENSDITFGGIKYTDAEIDKMKHDVDIAESEVAARKSDVSNWESKVSLNDTKEHRANGDYANAVSRLNEAKQRYNYALERLNSARSKLRNAQ